MAGAEWAKVRPLPQRAADPAEGAATPPALADDGVGTRRHGATTGSQRRQRRPNRGTTWLRRR